LQLKKNKTKENKQKKAGTWCGWENKNFFKFSILNPYFLLYSFSGKKKKSFSAPTLLNTL
jgi:hypothetical protein